MLENSKASSTATNNLPLQTLKSQSSSEHSLQDADAAPSSPATFPVGTTKRKSVRFAAPQSAEEEASAKSSATASAFSLSKEIDEHLEKICKVILLASPLSLCCNRVCFCITYKTTTVRCLPFP